MLARLIIGFFAVALAVLLTGKVYLEQWANAPLNLPPQGLQVQVLNGDSLGAISLRLADLNVIRRPRLLNLQGKLTGADQRIRQGEYLLVYGTTPEALLRRLQSGDTVRYLVTLPEGIRLADALEILWNSDGIDATLDSASDPGVKELIAPKREAEGLFLPESYQYQRGDSDLSILVAAHKSMQEALAEAWAARSPGLPYENAYELLIMASIIEKETGVAHERAAIAGVFTRRLLKGMRLQTDPTVIYGLGESFDGDLRRVHLRDETNLYNSYRHHGLPPGPIALPGRAALFAAAQPQAGNALYFVARGDGTHKFSDTLQEHEAAVKQYQLSRKANYRSSVEKGTR